ncbi:MAG: hypothetical protein CRU78_17570 [Candidatus Accumulibacter phosphatis]|jgi:hypothetical protein|uniref:Uncharacterized protein n=1 Tax=Candidatus Accumulibacter phosphatis TaxID=327160 RepID=A0A6A7RXL1_9PROT|nr:hypothetical protein [Candidatus Accumulibacter phosphatis]
MKKELILAFGGLVLGAGAFVPAHAAAVAACTGTAGPAVAALAAATDGSQFLRETMQFKCSSNVFLNADEDTAKAWVAAASRKGRYYWGGNTDGGSAARLGTAEVSSGTDPTPGGQLDAAKVAGAAASST